MFLLYLGAYLISIGEYYMIIITANYVGTDYYAICIIIYNAVEL